MFRAVSIGIARFFSAAEHAEHFAQLPIREYFFIYSTEIIFLISPIYACEFVPQFRGDLLRAL